MTSEIADEIKARIASIGYTVTSADSALIDYMTEAVGRYIMNFCNRDSVPSELESAWIDAVAGEFLYQKKAMGALGDAFSFASAVESIKEGDTQVSFNTDATSAEAAFDALISKLRTIDTSQLLRFRRLVW